MCLAFFDTSFSSVTKTAGSPSMKKLISCFVFIVLNNSRTAQKLTASDDLIGNPVVIEAKPQQFIDKVMVRLEVL